MDYHKYKNEYSTLKNKFIKLKIPPLNKPTLMTNNEVIALKIKDNKKSIHPELDNYTFLTNNQGEFGFLVTMLNIKKFPDLGKATLLSVSEVIALKIQPNNKSIYPELTDYIFIINYRGIDKGYLVTMLRLPPLNKPTIMSTNEVIALKIKYENKKSIYEDLSHYQFITEDKGNQGFLVTMLNL